MLFFNFFWLYVIRHNPPAGGSSLLCIIARKFYGSFHIGLFIDKAKIGTMLKLKESCSFCREDIMKQRFAKRTKTLYILAFLRS